MDGEKEALIAKMELVRAQLNTALEKVAPQTEIYPSWKVKHLLDHITGWDVLVAASFRTQAQGGTQGKVVHGIDRYNARSVQERESLSFDQSRQAFDHARAEVIQAVRDMPDEKLGVEYQAPWGGTCTVPSVMKIFIHHEQEHARQIEELLSQP